MRPKRTGWAWALATCFGVGFLRPAPGTWGSGVGLLLWLAAAHWLHPSPMYLALGTAVGAILVLLAGIPASSTVAREAAIEDPGFVVLDEVVGQWIALIAAGTRTWEWLLAFALFRVFDILKPPPARQFDRMHGGFGIMMDDVAAGIYAMAVVWLVRLFSTGWRF
ncbi:MAG TPA: phosphatidylglycerophosphatase A [Acidobacteriaceae bacterium]|nr:phosphatidylglycerophosphatase A [Acidobacteriaceae bacterium]